MAYCLYKQLLLSNMGPIFGDSVIALFGGVNKDRSAMETRAVILLVGYMPISAWGYA
jgi:hypothetical protein